MNSMDKSIEAAALAIDGEAFDPANENWRYWSSRRKQAIAKARAAIAAYRDAEIERLTAELEVERLRLAVCGTAALGYFEDCAPEYRSASLDDVFQLRANLQTAEDLRDSLYGDLAELRAKFEAAERDAARYRWLRNRSPRDYCINCGYDARGLVVGDDLDNEIDALLGGERG